jgi:hypothetical protein
MVLPVAFWNDPGAHGVQVNAFDTLLKEPTGQLKQSRAPW